MRVFILTTLAISLVAGPAAGQLTERPGGRLDAARGPRDVSGLSIKTPRIRLMHTTTLEPAGGSYWLQEMDPFLAYKWGKDLTQREYRRDHGVFAAGSLQDIAGFQGSLTDRFTPAMLANDQVSCGGCHGNPYRDGGAGTNFTKKAGLGRNATHFFGAGLQEMIAWQVRQQMLQQADTDRNGWISFDEQSTRRLLVRPTPDAEPIDYGTTADEDGDGHPDLNTIFRIWYVDGEGRALEDAPDLGHPGVAGFNFLLEVFGWGEKPTQYQGLVRGRAASLIPTSRIFVWDPFESHSGMEAFDPTSFDDPDRDGLSGISNAGFQQTWIGHKTPDRGIRRNSVGLSIDDPDGDGCISELSEGDIDVGEWYVINHPRPGLARQTDETKRGKALFSEYGCNSCHVQDWKIEAADPGHPDPHFRYSGDLRFFDLDVSWNGATGRLEGRLERLYDVDATTGRHVRRKGSFMVRGIGTDFKHHDVGEDFYEMAYDGAIVTRWRTGLLWGNGASGYPWGHDGASMTLESVVLRHGGEALASRNAFADADDGDRDAVLAWLRSQILYPTELVPTDIDGDGRISRHFLVDGRDTGIERFNAEWLFRTPARIEGQVEGPDGERLWSDAVVNIDEAYGLGLPAIRDQDADAFPDLLDECPETYGMHDGCL